MKRSVNSKMFIIAGMILIVWSLIFIGCVLFGVVYPGKETSAIVVSGLFLYFGIISIILGW